MAEAFARAYGSDVLVAASAGLAPAMMVAPDTARSMAEKNIEMAEHFPKGLQHIARAGFEMVINMSGTDMGKEFGGGRVVDWDIPDPIGLEYEEHCVVRDQI